MSEATAQLGLDFECRPGGRTVLARREVRYPHHVTAPLAGRPAAELVVQSASGGLYGGERLQQRVTLGDAAQVTLRFPSATVVHAARGQGAARQAVDLRLAPRSALRYLQRPLILLPGARLAQTLHARIAPGARLLWCEGVSLHDPAPQPAPPAPVLMPAPPGSRAYDSRLTVSDAEGRPLLVDRLLIDDTMLHAAVPGVSGGLRAFGALWWIGEPPAAGWQPWRDAVRTLASAGGGASLAASSLPNGAGLVMRVGAADGGALDAALTALLLMVAGGRTPGPMSDARSTVRC